MGDLVALPVQPVQVLMQHLYLGKEPTKKPVQGRNSACNMLAEGVIVLLNRAPSRCRIIPGMWFRGGSLQGAQ